MKVLALTRYDSGGPSSRYRVYQYLPYLRAAGLEIVEAPLLDHSYVEGLYQGGRPSLVQLARSALRRLHQLASASRYDVVWMEKELFPFAPSIVESLLHYSSARVVVDYDDAVFHRYDSHTSRLVRTFLGGKIDFVMSSAALVVAGNRYLADRAKQAGAKAVTILPTVIDLDRYPDTTHPEPDRFTIGWIGSPVTQKHLAELAPTLAAFCRDTDAQVVGIGVDPNFTMEGVPLKALPWSEQTEVRDLRQCDVGIMPLPDSPWERGKCGFKIIQYMGCGLPVIASPVGVNSEIVVDGKTGNLASSPDQWLEALGTLRSSKTIRAKMGESGRARAKDHYSLQSMSPRLLDALRSVLGTRWA